MLTSSLSDTKLSLHLFFFLSDFISLPHNISLFAYVLSSFYFLLSLTFCFQSFSPGFIFCGCICAIWFCFLYTIYIFLSLFLFLTPSWHSALLCLYFSTIYVFLYISLFVPNTNAYRIFFGKCIRNGKKHYESKDN